jgi:hypothetical protein
MLWPSVWRHSADQRRIDDAAKAVSNSESSYAGVAQLG